MLKLKIVFFLFSLLLLACSSTYAQAPVVGKKAAAKYFKREPAQEVDSESDSHYLGIHIGKYLGTQAYEWGQSGKQEDVGGDWSAGITYKFEEWSHSDLNIRVDFNEFKVLGEKPLKMSLMPLVTFPESSSKFPLYFGAGAGLGIFFKQLKEESTLTFDYQLVAGARFFNVFENGGFFIETGLKNHLQLLSSGQLNGTFLSVGALFTF